MLFGKKDAGEILNESYSIKFRKTDCSFGCTLQEHVGTKSINSILTERQKLQMKAIEVYCYIKKES